VLILIFLSWISKSLTTLTLLPLFPEVDLNKSGTVTRQPCTERLCPLQLVCKSINQLTSQQNIHLVRQAVSQPVSQLVIESFSNLVTS
jgi:hypothetical protein